MFRRTTAINKILAMNKRKKVIQGGTWAGKTFGLMAVIPDYCIKRPKYKVTVTAETIPAIKEGALSQFQEIMQETNRWVQDRFNKNELTYTFSNNTRLQFRSFDSVGKAKAAGKRNALFINEGNYLPYEIADALIMRTEDDIWIDFNPDNEFWAHTEILPQDDAAFLLLKYTDNEGCPQTIIDELNSKLHKAYHNPLGDRKDPKNIKSEYWANWCRVYIDGNIGSLQGVVFDNWRQIDSLPLNARLVAIGLDFGYTNDPTAIVAYYRHDNRIIFDELAYRKGLLNSDIAALLKTFKIGDTIIYADSAEPKSIDEIKTYGHNIVGTNKGKDSINYGISLLQQEDFFITARSLNLIRELRSYTWDKNRTGETLNTPIDAWNHAIDAMRYIALNRLKQEYPSQDLSVLSAFG